MSANIFGNRFFGNREPAWHGLGVVSQTDMNAVSALTSLGGGYWFEKRPVTIFMNNEDVKTGDYGLVRSPVPDDPIERNFGYVTDNYNIVQPLEVCEIFDASVKQPVETLGMLGKGERMFLTWILPQIDIHGDPIRVYGFVACGYDAKMGFSLNVVYTRVVCQNTWSVAINEAQNNKEEGKGQIWRGRHNTNSIARDLGIWMEHVQTKAEQHVAVTQALFCKFKETPVDNLSQVKDVVQEVYPDPLPVPSDYPEKLRSERQAKVDVAQEKANNDRSLVEELFCGMGTDIEYDYWGVFNAISEYENWGRSTKKDASASIMVGKRADAVSRAFNVIAEKIGEPVPVVVA